jgi:hypothetical protein
MQKFLLVSVLLATILVPVLIHQRRMPDDFPTVLKTFGWFMAAWVLGLLYLYPRLA